MQLPVYKPTKKFDPRLVYEVWLKLVQDEQLYDALMEGKHADRARQLGLGVEEILILDDFGVQPGTRWHMENLRFRCTTMVSRILGWHLPATIQLLTDGNREWLRDLVFEYIAGNRWQDFGHHRRLAECARFAAFVRTRVMKRRRPPDHLGTVMDFELAIHELLDHAALIPPNGWPNGTSPGPEVIVDLRLRPGPAVRVIDLPVDLVAWLGRPEGRPVVTGTEPVAALVYVSSLTEGHKIERLDAVGRLLFESCKGERPVAEFLALPQLAPHRAACLSLLDHWLKARCLRP